MVLVPVATLRPASLVRYLAERWTSSVVSSSATISTSGSPYPTSAPWTTCHQQPSLTHPAVEIRGG